MISQPKREMNVPIKQFFVKAFHVACQKRVGKHGARDLRDVRVDGRDLAERNVLVFSDSLKRKKGSQAVVSERVGS